MKKVAIFVILVVTFAIAQVTMGQIAITEFLNDPLGADTDMGSEFIELYEEAHKDRYSFLYLKLSENTAEAYVRHEYKIYPTRDGDEVEELEID